MTKSAVFLACSLAFASSVNAGLCLLWLMRQWNMTAAFHAGVCAFAGLLALIVAVDGGGAGHD